MGRREGKDRNKNSKSYKGEERDMERQEGERREIPWEINDLTIDSVDLRECILF